MSTFTTKFEYMQSVFDKNGNRLLIERVEKLTPITLSQWGKMTVSQMLEHCQQPIKVSYGQLNLKPNLMSFLFGKMMKKKLSEPQPFARDLPTVKQFKITHEPDFEKAKAELIRLVKKFAEEGHASIKNTKHPFFGEMTMQEWDYLQWKHLDHHLRQFGV
ncbi:DUF1569 domain-containing protein [Flavobacterium coralii]|uniref:DUF1569 domain-containing protein n=1 Tax=Flavobacterium coralii TaxID=2838017 RepID=UPI000C358EDA|nr:hypothetical protein [Flavobacterium sp.]|tara:strand:+ start:8704 stop:9183 length:480 start_codon:yes stop_codon:yes gene_type:complete